MDFPDDLPVVYLVDGSVAVTGAFVCARNIARALAGRARVVLVLPAHSTIGPNDTTPFAGVRRLPIRPLRRNFGAVLAYLPALVVASFALRWLMRRDRATVLIVNDFYLMYGALCRALGFRGRLLTWVRIDPAAFGARLSGLWLRLAAASSDRLVAVSLHIQGRLPKGIGSELLYDALDPLPEPLPPVAADRFVCVGNYIPGKGQDHAVEAFAAVAAEYPNLTLHFHGGDMGLPRNRAYRAALATRVRELCLVGRIHLHDFAPDPFNVLQGALAALNFSTAESFSMTVLEAQGAGLPVIATRSGGPAEIVVHSVTGLLVPVSDISAMSAAMRTLARDPVRAASMGKAARERVEQLFSLHSFRAGLTALLALPAYAGTEAAP